MEITAAVIINLHHWDVAVAQTDAELRQGLGGLSFIPANTGMLFDMGAEQHISMTTVPMQFSLDVIFISLSTMKVVDIVRDMTPGNDYVSQVDAQYFMEVNAGEFVNVSIGDSVEIAGYTPIPQQESTISLIAGFAMLAGMMALAAMIIKDSIGIIKENRRG